MSQNEFRITRLMCICLTCSRRWFRNPYLCRPPGYFFVSSLFFSQAELKKNAVKKSEKQRPSPIKRMILQQEYIFVVAGHEERCQWWLSPDQLQNRVRKSAVERHQSVLGCF